MSDRTTIAAWLRTTQGTTDATWSLHTVADMIERGDPWEGVAATDDPPTVRAECVRCGRCWVDRRADRLTCPDCGASVQPPREGT